MKKIISVVFLFLIITSISYFMYSKYSSKSITLAKEVTSPEDCVRRHFLNSVLLEKCLGVKMKDDSIFTLNNCEVIIANKMLNGFEVKMVNNNDTLNSFFSFTSAQNDKKSILGFTSTQKVNSKSVFLQTATAILQKAETFFNDEEKVYGFKTKMERTADFYLLSLKNTDNRKPTTEEVYKLIGNVENYIALKQGKIKNPPMLNVYEEELNKYTTMVAVPTTKQIEGQGNIYFKQLVDGNLLTAIVKGGSFTVEQAEAQLKIYLTEYKKTSPAIPYQTLITNRLQEKDTTKWITKLNYPVFY